MTYPKVSIIVPIYKVEEFLEQCFAALDSQTYPDLEIILVDDGSPDNCGARCDEYAKGKTRILVSHDLSTVIDADAILVLDHGRVAGFGTHEELLRSCPQYAGLLSAGEEVVR